MNQWGLFSAGVRLTQIELDYNTSLEGDWIRYVYDDDDFRPDPDQKYIVLTPENINSSLRQTETNYGGYIEQVFEQGEWDVSTGVRFERDGFADQSVASPRFSANWRPNRTINVFSTAGLFHQSPRFLDLAANESNNLENEKITHSSVGFEIFPSPRWSVLTEAYYQNLDNLVVDLDRANGTFANIGDGRSYGVDIVVKGAPREGLYATATYSYNKASGSSRTGCVARLIR